MRLTSAFKGAGQPAAADGVGGGGNAGTRSSGRNFRRNQQRQWDGVKRMLPQKAKAVQCLDLPSSSRPGSKLRSGSGLWTIDILLDAFNTPLETSDTLVTPSEEELQSSQSLRGLPRQESRCNKSKRSAEISTPAASVIQTREVKLHKLQADVSGLRAPEAVPAPSTSASYRMKTANPRSSSCSPCLTSGDHLAFFQADGQDLIDIPQRKDARGGRVDAVPCFHITKFTDFFMGTA
ncbi:hypothetical protein V8E36_001975 [Tilletia maclaganii]